MLRLRMKSSSRLILVLVIIFLFAQVISGCSQNTSQDQQVEKPTDAEKPAAIRQLTFGTGNPTGGYMLMATAIAKIVNQNVEGINLTPVPSPRVSVENIETVDSREREFGLASAPMVVAAGKGEDPFTKKQDVLGWFSAHYGVVYAIATEASGIKSFKDFEGKRVAIGTPGSNDDYLTTNVWYPATGVDINKVKIELVKLQQAVDLMKDGHLDAFIITGAPRLAMIEDLASSRKVRYVPIDENILQQIVIEQPMVTIREFKQSDYPKVLMDQPSYKIPTTNHFAVVSPDLEEELVYEMTKAIFENLQDIYDVKEEFQVMTLEGALAGMPIDVHPSALKYFNEKGISQ